MGVGEHSVFNTLVSKLVLKSFKEPYSYGVSGIIDIENRGEHGDTSNEGSYSASRHKEKGPYVTEK